MMMVREVFGEVGGTLLGVQGPRGEVARSAWRVASMLDWSERVSCAVWRETCGPLYTDLLRLGDVHAERLALRWEGALLRRVETCPDESPASRLAWLVQHIEREAGRGN